MSLERNKGGIVDLFTQVFPGGVGTDLPIPRSSYRDSASLTAWPSHGVVDYLFEGAGELTTKATDPAAVVAELDNAGVELAQVFVHEADVPAFIERLGETRDRFFIAVGVNPHEGMQAVRRLESLTRAHPEIKACSLSPHHYWPPLAPSSREYYPLYAKCVELDLPVFVNVGIPGPRVPSSCQDPIHLDEVCWFFPELTIIMKHGGEPWTDICVKLMLKWPNLYYATSAMAPKHYPGAIIQYANTRGADRVMYAGYYPILSYPALLSQLAGLPLRSHVWDPFLSENARRVFRLPPRS